MTELEDLKAELDKLETSEKCEDMRDKIKAKQKDLKYRSLKKGWKDIVQLFGGGKSSR